MPSSRILFFSAISFIIGVFLGNYPIIFFLLSLSCFLVLTDKKIGLFLLMIAFGSSWYLFFDSREMTEIDSYQGRVIQTEQTVLSGGVLLITNREYQIGDILRLNGKIKPVEKDNSYFKKEKIGLVALYPEVEVVGHKSSLREKALHSLSSSLPNPQLSIIAAMLLGEKKLISSEWKEKLSSTGTRHITAVSGLHVTIIGSIIVSLFGFLGRRRALLLSLIGIFFFVVMTGLQSSAIRAGIMGATLVIASFFGRMSVSYRSLVLAAALMLLFNPFLLRYDIGFQLSFLSVLGIIYLSPIIKRKLSFLPKIAQESLAISFSAYLFTLPVTIYYFKELSLVFPITNFLIVPVLYPIMIVALLFVLLQPISFLILFPLWFLLTYLVTIIDLFSRLSWSSVAVGPTMIAVTIFIILFILSGKKSPDEIE